MSLRMKLLALVFSILLVLPAALFSQQTHKKPSHKARVKQQPAQQLPPVPSGPLQQLPLDTVPAVAPEVSYQNGNLTIEAHNSNLTDILKAVQTHTGATIDVPPSTNERVVTQLGPGPARDVLAKLLNGSHYNYVMLGSPSDPNAISKVILTSKVTGGPDAPNPGGQSAAAQPPSRPVYQGMPRPAQVMPPPNPQAAAEEQEEPEPEQEAEEGGNDPSEQRDSENQAAPAQGAQQAPGQQGPKTPEQLLQDLQRQQQLLQQQQQQNQQQAKPNQPPQE